MMMITSVQSVGQRDVASHRLFLGLSKPCVCQDIACLSIVSVLGSMLLLATASRRVNALHGGIVIKINVSTSLSDL
jgi:hypothetical protein